MPDTGPSAAPSADPPAPSSPSAPPVSRPIDTLTGGQVPHGLTVAAGVTWRVLVLLAAVVVISTVAGRLTPVVFALFFALVVTALAEPIVRRIKPHMPDALAVALTLLVMAVVVSLVFGFVFKSIVDEMPALVEQLQKGFDQIAQWLVNGPLHVDPKTLEQIPAALQAWAKSQAGSVASIILGEVSSLFTLITAASVFLFAVFFFLHSPTRLWSWVVSWAPPRSRTIVDTGGDVAWGTMSGYVRGIILVALADSIFVLIGLLILRIPLAPVLAVVVFFGALIPVIGAPIATLLAAVVALATEGPVKALLVVLLTILVGSFDGDVLQPLIMGKAVSLHPLAIVTILAIGTIAGGLLGALVCVPLFATAYAMAKYLTGRMPEVGAPDPAPPSSA